MEKRVAATTYISREPKPRGETTITMEANVGTKRLTTTPKGGGKHAVCVSLEDAPRRCWHSCCDTAVAVLFMHASEVANPGSFWRTELQPASWPIVIAEYAKYVNLRRLSLQSTNHRGPYLKITFMPGANGTDAPCPLKGEWETGISYETSCVLC